VAKIYLIRHGESIANTQGVYQGQTHDTPLSVLGMKQARAVAKRFRYESITAVYTSPLIRTRQTAEAIVRYHPEVPITVEPRIIETNHGLWEGKPVAYIQKKWPDIYKTWLDQPVDVTFPGGETLEGIMRRVVAWWDGFVHTAKGTAIVVSHDNIIRMLLVHLLHMDGNALWTFQLQPTGITTIDVVGKTVVVCINDTNHLEGLEANLANHAL